MRGKRTRETGYSELLFILVLLFLAIPPVSATVLTYDGTGNASSIQQLINVSSSGDSVLVSGGKYYEDILIDHPLIFGALDRNNPPEIVSGAGIAGITLTGKGIVIDCIRISGNARYGLLLQSDNNKIYNISVSGLETGIGLQSAVHNELSKNSIINNTVGIDMDRDSQANTFFMNYFDNPVDVVDGSTDTIWSSKPWIYQYSGKNFSGSLGNFWTKYNGADMNGDGIGDQPYPVQQNASYVPGNQPNASVIDRAPLIKSPGFYTLMRSEAIPVAGVGSSLPGNNNGLPTGSVIQTEQPILHGPGPFPGNLLQFWWIVPIVIIMSIVAGIWFERTWRRRTPARDEEDSARLSRNVTVVNSPHPISDTGTGYQRQYAAHLPPALEKKYPKAEYIAEGGVSRVFRAYDAKEGRKVAVKVPIRFDEVTGSQFTKELHVWEGLHHPNIVEIYAANIFPVPYIEMEYVESSLTALHFPLETGRATAIITGVAQGLRYAHEQGIVHRDIKPDNIMVAPDGTPKISDWGLSKAEGTKQSGIIGFSLEYAAPEQLAPNLYGEPGPWTDIYQLGVLFYEMLSGQVPFKGGGMGEVTHAILHDETPELPLVGPDAAVIQNIIRKCMQKRPGDRFSSVAEILSELKKIAH
jgi:parallel beta-helix repeat protein